MVGLDEYNIVKYHHEMLDGTGYPNKLKANQIPLEAKIITVADIFDALTSKRPYKKVWSFEEAFDELNQMQKNGKLEKDCVVALQENRNEIFDIYERFQDPSF